MNIKLGPFAYKHNREVNIKRDPLQSFDIIVRQKRRDSRKLMIGMNGKQDLPAARRQEWSWDVYSY